MSLFYKYAPRWDYDDPHAYVARKHAYIEYQTRRLAILEANGLPIPEGERESLQAAREHVALARRSLPKDKKE